MPKFYITTVEKTNKEYEVNAFDFLEAIEKIKRGEFDYGKTVATDFTVTHGSIVLELQKPDENGNAPKQVVSGEKAKRKYKRKFSKGAFGQHNPMPPAVAKQIYDLAKVGNFTYRQIAEKFRTSKQTVQNIASGRLHYPDLLKQAA